MKIFTVIALSTLLAGAAQIHADELLADRPGALLGKGAERPGFHKRTLKTEKLELRYGLTVPKKAKADDVGEARPLVLALHYGFDRSREFPAWYGKNFMERVVAPGLEPLGAYIVAPDSHGMPWSDERITDAVLSLLDSLTADPRIDGSKVIVTGYSMGGAGTWYFASQHTERFAAAVPMAGRLRAEWLDQIGDLPVHVLHSRDDELISAAQVESLVAGRDGVVFTALDGITHFESPRYASALKAIVAPWLAEQLTEQSGLP